jgi:glycosyltransferase involved in cell wall biosynthesis
MMAALQSHCGGVLPLGPACENWYFGARIACAALRRLTGYRIDYTHLRVISKMLARRFEERIAAAELDVIFAPVASTEIAFLQTNVPIVYYGDLTAKLFLNYSENLMGLAGCSLAQTELLERRALRRADHLVYASEWAAKSCIVDYGIDDSRVSVVPMGANLEETPSREVALSRVAPSQTECRLLFIGVDWERKGALIAFRAMEELRARGINASLTVVGCVPPRNVHHPDLHFVPFLNKSLPEERVQLNELFLRSHFMLFPTRREAYGIVCCEANAFGLPLITSDLGGIPVRPGENGIQLPASASGLDYASAVQQLLEAPSRYFELVRAGRDAFDSRLNWDSWGRSMAGVFEHVLRASSLPRSLV